MLRKYSKTIALAGVVALLACGCATTATEGTQGADGNPYDLITPGEIIAATSGDQPLFSTVTKGGAPKGFAIDLTDEVARLLELTVRYKLVPTAAEIPGLTSGQYDVVSNGFGVTEKREEAVNFSQAIHWDTVDLMSSKDSSMTTMDDMAGKKIAVITGSIQVDYLAQFPTAVPVMFQGSNEAVSALNSGTVEGFVWSGRSMLPYLEQFPSLKIAVTEPVVDHPTSMMFQNDNTALTEAFNEQLKAMSKDGTFKKIFDKHFGADFTVPSQLLELYPELKR